jgi:FAD-dependent oxidoreductase domain-containing protein 1
MGARIVVIGGGVIGSATACFLARDLGCAVTVIERDPSYRCASSALSASSIRQQFSQPANIALSRWSYDFLHRSSDELAVGGQRPDIGLTSRGYLYLATGAGEATLRDHHAVQRACGADVKLLDPAALARRFAWLHTADLALGSLGLAGEGWFDGYALLQAFKRKAMDGGARFVTAEAAAFEQEGEFVRAVTLHDGASVACDAVLIAAGAWSAPLAAQLGVHLPVHARKRDVFVVRSPASIQDGPLVVDASGVWFRPEGAGFICGAPPRGEDVDDAPLSDVDHGLFDAVIWPALAHRVPAFEALRVTSAWAGYYEMNLFDHNGLAGPLPGWRNAFVACGFSGHGMQQSPAVGHGMARWIVQGSSGTIDLQPLAPSRLAEGRRLIERNVI